MFAYHNWWVSPIVVVVMVGARGPLLFIDCGGGRRRSPSLVDGVAWLRSDGGELKLKETSMSLIQHQQRSENAER